MGYIKYTPQCLHIKWGGLLVKNLISILGIEGSNLTSDMIVVNNDMLTKYTLCLGGLGLSTYFPLPTYLD
jgi:hypothetical protein